MEAASQASTLARSQPTPSPSNPSTFVIPDLAQMPASVKRSRLVAIILIVSVFATALNLRSVTVALPLYMDTIRTETGINATATGLLTTLPILCWAILSMFVPRIARPLGIDRTIIATLGLLCVGIVIRIAPPVGMLFLGTIVIGIALALANVLLPAAVKRDFPDKLGPMMGVYGVGFSLGGALASAVMKPIQHATGFDWRPTLGLLAVPVAIAIVLMLPRIWIIKPAPTAVGTAPDRLPNLWRDGLAWQISIFMGVQSFVFYGLGTWTPTILVEKGVAESASDAAWTISQLFGVVSSLVVPLVIGRGLNQKVLICVIACLFSTGILGMLLAPTLAPAVWLIAINLAGSASMSTVLMFIVQRSPDTQHAAALSGMSQAVGYAIAAVSPSLFGLLHDLSGGWTLPTVIVLLDVIVVVITGFGAARPRMVGQRAPTPIEADTAVVRLASVD